MSGWAALLVGLLAAVATRLLLGGSPARRAQGIILIGLAVNLLVFTMTGAVHGRAPLVDAGETQVTGTVADPIPQALVLTAIVIGFALQAFALVLLMGRNGDEGAGDGEEAAS